MAQQQRQQQGKCKGNSCLHKIKLKKLKRDCPFFQKTVQDNPRNKQKQYSCFVFFRLFSGCRNAPEFAAPMQEKGAAGVVAGAAKRWLAAAAMVAGGEGFLQASHSGKMLQASA
ncbi:hypothetical protein [Botryobacter ruber]|uniref:hypothetical protein n=1 Tax=Botryobacter ruber TaxID=2171629 RepID=UPI000E0AE790|nr:hypothetical protein [Botryobacter ruber]